jgi:hypothetical protein
VLISKNHRLAKEAYYASEAGLAEGRARLKGASGDPNWAGDPDATPDPDWSAYILTPSIAAAFSYTNDPDYDPNRENYFPIPGGSLTNTSIQSNTVQVSYHIPYGVKIRHKREYDAEQAGHTPSSPHYIDNDGSTGGGHTKATAGAGSIIYYGYEDPARPYQLVQFTTSGATNWDPVEIIRAYGFGSRFGTEDHSMKIIEIEVVRHPGPAVAATIYSENDITFSGAANDVDGTNLGAAACGGDDLPPTYTLDPATTGWGGAGAPTLNGNPPNPVQGPQDYEIPDMVSAYWGMRDIEISPTSPADCTWNNEVWGDPANYITLALDCQTGSCAGNEIAFNNCDGYGLLLVHGNLQLSGTCNWTGLIIVDGTVTMGGGGGTNVLNLRGALMAQNTVGLNGNIEADYDSCAIADAFDTHNPKIISWKEVY